MTSTSAHADKKTVLVEHAAAVGEIPKNARVFPEQAESALGRTLATEIDVGYTDAVDADTKEEEEALAGHQVNPSGVASTMLASRGNRSRQTLSAPAPSVGRRPALLGGLCVLTSLAPRRASLRSCAAAWRT